MPIGVWILIALVVIVLLFVIFSRIDMEVFGKIEFFVFGFFVVVVGGILIYITILSFSDNKAAVKLLMELLQALS